MRKLVAFGDSLGIPVKYVCLVDYSNSRGASDMGLLPDLGPGYQPGERARSGLRRNSGGARSGRAVGGGRESVEARRAGLRPGFRRCPRYVSHRDGAARRRRVPGRFGLRKERHRDQCLRRSAAPEGRIASDGRQARSRNHRPALERNGREPRHLVRRQSFRRDSQERAWL